MSRSRKILTHLGLLEARARAKAEGKTLVHCHGCFDIVHPGHIRHLRFAREQGDVLLVTITGDASMRKGDGRPLIPEELRAENLAELDCVDWVYIEPRPTAAELLAEVKPDIYIKGKEYELNRDPRFEAERLAVESGGGRVVFSSGDVVFSSTALIAAMERSVDPFHKHLAHLTQHEDLANRNLVEIIARFRDRRIVVVGETILDTYIACDQPDVAGESPVLTLRPIQRRQYEGGAAIIARHAAAMGARATLVTALPRTPAAESVRRRLAAEGVEVLSISTDAPIAEKQRFLVGAQKVMKLDLIEPMLLDGAQQQQLVSMAIDAAGDACDAAIIADFGLGLFNAELLRRLCIDMRPLTGILAGDVSGRRSHLRRMQRADLLCPSERELRDSLHRYDEGLPAVVAALLDETRSRSAIVTMGADGLMLFELPRDDAKGWDKRLQSRHIPALAPFAIDPLGCGDALLTASTLALAGGASSLSAAFLGALAAAAQAQRLGNLPVSASDLRQGVTRMHTAHLAFATAEVIASRTPRPDIAIEPAARAS
ncbi:MAG: adenylyltransferase/cytidyltransferase family protein [Phycisphaeraceae bacterium]|nr:adenylyltransferase/cytidyltransferase family protein [Phycisphaeraceae bacterium]MCW5753652.1 adenylyltransferase/cytidyltransferase family protein [Phycisphaeraceae bacterium]